MADVDAEFATGMTHRVGRLLAIVGAAVIWLPFAALTVLSLLVALSGPGLGEGAATALVGLAIVVIVPLATWLALRSGSVVSAVLLVVVGAAVPLAWAPLLRPDHSEPLHLISRLAAIGGAAMIVGALLMLRHRRVGE